jgi:hypothetical protein
MLIAATLLAAMLFGAGPSTFAGAHIDGNGLAAPAGPARDAGVHIDGNGKT